MSRRGRRWRNLMLRNLQHHRRIRGHVSIWAVQCNLGNRVNGISSGIRKAGVVSR